MNSLIRYTGFAYTYWLQSQCIAKKLMVAQTTMTMITMILMLMLNYDDDDDNGNNDYDDDDDCDFDVCYKTLILCVVTWFERAYFKSWQSWKHQAFL